MDPVKLLTFNVWGLKYVSKLRRERIEGIVEKLQDPSESYDIISLQEVWCQEDWELFDNELKNLYPYRRWFKSGTFAGPGLAVLSKIPILETFLYRFPNMGRAAAVNRGDFYVGKSISIVTLNNGLVLLNSHMHAPYTLTGDDAYVAHRSIQAWDFCKIINNYKKMGYQIIVTGDLNSKPGSLPHKLFTIEANLKDSWEIFKKNSGENLISLNELSKLSPKDQILIGGITCDSQLNSWNKHKELNKACRLDYVLVTGGIDIIDASVKFIDNLPNYNCSYSDHFAYYAKLIIKEPQVPIPIGDDFSIEKFQIYKELINEINYYLDFTIPKHYYWRKYYFFISILLLIILIILTPISDGFSTLIIILSIIISITGVLNGLIWFLGGNQEKRCFEEVKAQVMDVINVGSLI